MSIKNIRSLVGPARFVLAILGSRTEQRSFRNENLHFLELRQVRVRLQLQRISKNSRHIIYLMDNIGSDSTF